MNSPTVSEFRSYHHTSCLDAGPCQTLLIPVWDSMEQVIFAEDYYLGNCLATLGVEALNTQDSRGRDRFMPFPPAHHLLFRFPTTERDWYVDYTTNAGSPAKEGIEGVSPYAISFHYVKDDLMDRMHAMLYGACDRYAVDK